MESGNFALDAMVIGPEWKRWEHRFIENGVPCCDVKNKIIYSPAFKLNLSKKEEELVRGKNLHEAAHAHYTPPVDIDDPQLHSIVNALEDLRIERLVAENNPVFGYDIRKMNEYIFEDIKKLLQTGKKFPPMEKALSWLMFETLEFKDLFELQGKSKDMAKKAYSEFQTWKNAETFDEILSIAKNIQALWFEDTKAKTQNPETEIENSVEDFDAENSNTPEPSSEKSKQKESNSQKLPSEKSNPEENPLAPEKESGIKAEILRNAFKQLQETSWDKYDRFTDNDEFKDPKENAEKYFEARERISNSIMKISQYTRSALFTLSRCKKMTGQESGTLDKRRLVDIAMGTKRNIFYHTTKGISLDTAITILLDASGSMYDNEEEVRSLCIALAEAFENMKMKFEILGFTTGYSDVDFESSVNPHRTRINKKLVTYLFKQFHERYTTCKYRIGNYKAISENIDGESLMIAWNRNKAQKAKRHIVFVVSDGLPSCHPISETLLQEDLKRTISVIRKQQGEVYAFGINTKSPEIYYGEENFVYIEDVSNLGVNFFKKLQEVISK